MPVAEATRKTLSFPRRHTLPVERVLLEEPAPPFPLWWTPMKAAVHRGVQETRHFVCPYVRLTDEGPDWGVEPNPGDEIGWCMDPNRPDTCFPAGLASATQVPLDEVPYHQVYWRIRRGATARAINKRVWEALVRWASGRGLTVCYWEKDELPVPRERWLGVTGNEFEGEGEGEPPPEAHALLDEFPALRNFGRHALLMKGDEVLFDPACSYRPMWGTQPKSYSLDDIEYGLSFETGGD